MKYLRWLLSIALLIVVWLHAHWSVALSLSLIFIYIELTVALHNPRAGRWDTH